MAKQKFKKTHKGLFVGIVPIYLDMREPNCPWIEPRGIFSALSLPIVEVVFHAFLTIYSLINPEEELSYPLLITGEFVDTDRKRTLGD